MKAHENLHMDFIIVRARAEKHVPLGIMFSKLKHPEGDKKEVWDKKINSSAIS